MAAPMGLNDSFTEEGFWWIEGREKEQVGGTLTYDQENGPVLHLLGTLRDLVTSMNATFGADRSSDRQENVYGITNKGKPVTLINAMITNRQLNMPGITNETWKSDLLVIGCHLKDKRDDEIFQKSYLRFESIERWLGHRPFTATHHFEERALTIRVDKPREEQFADHAEFRVTTVGSIYSNNTPDTRYTLEAVSQIGIDPKIPKSLSWHFAAAVKIQELAALCTGHYLPLTSLELRGPDRNRGGETMRPVEVHVYARMMHPEGESRPQHEAPVLSGPELIAFNPKALQLWFDQYELFSSAIALFFTVAGQKQMFTNIRFILAIQALEVFHRRTSSAGVMPDEEFEAFYNRLVHAIPDPRHANMKQKLSGTCKHLNDLSLGQRLRAIVDELGAEFGFKLPAFNKAYLRKLVATRNYYTHFSEELKDATLDGGGMYWASRRMALLLTLLFLRRLGIAGSDLLPLLERHHQFAKLWASDRDPF